MSYSTEEERPAVYDVQEVDTDKSSMQERPERGSNPSGYSALQLIRECLREVPFPESQEARDVIEELLKWKKELPQEMTLSSLFQFESYLTDSHNTSVDFLKHCIQLLDAPSVSSRVGLNTLVWSQLTEASPGGQIAQQHKEVLRDAGLDPARMQVAARAHRLILNTPAHSSIALATYELGSVLQSCDSLSLHCNSIQHWMRPGRSITHQEVQKFSLEGVAIEEGYPYGKRHRYGAISQEVQEGDVFYAFFLDAPVSLVLHYQSRPVAFVAGLASADSTLFINEIQTVRPRRLIQDDSSPVIEHLSTNHWELEPFHWRAFLVQTLSQIAASLGYSRVGIQSGNNNPWIKPDVHDEVHLPIQRARQIYDATARHLGMELSHDGNFYGKMNTVLCRDARWQADRGEK